MVIFGVRTLPTYIKFFIKLEEYEKFEGEKKTSQLVQKKKGSDHEVQKISLPTYLFNSFISCFIFYLLMLNVKVLLP